MNVLLLIGVVALSSAAAEPHQIAVLPLEPAGTSAQLAGAADLLVPTEVRRLRPDLRVVSSAELASLVGLERQRQLLGCETDGACVAELGGALGVDELLSGRLGRLGNTLVLELRRLDVRNGSSRGSTTRSVRSEDDLVGAVRSAVRELYPPPRAAGSSSSSPHASRRLTRWLVGGGGALAVLGAASAGWVLTGPAAAYRDGQPAAGNFEAPTLTRAQADRARLVHGAGLAGAGLGTALLGWGVVRWLREPDAPATTSVSVVPTAGGLHLSAGGSF